MAGVNLECGKGLRIKSTEDEPVLSPSEVGLLPVLESCSPHSHPDVRPSHKAPPIGLPLPTVSGWPLQGCAWGSIPVNHVDPKDNKNPREERQGSKSRVPRIFQPKRTSRP